MEIKLKENTKKALDDLVGLINLMERASSKISGLLDTSEIYQSLREEFSKSKNYVVSILLLTEGNSHLRIIMTSTPSKIINKAEMLTGFRIKKYEIDLRKSSVYRRVVKEGKIVQTGVDEILAELFPRFISKLISKIMNYKNKKCIIVPLTLYGDIIGAFAITSTRFSDWLIPSVKNMAYHISSVLESADRDRKLKESEACYSLLFKNVPVGIGLTTFDGQLLDCNKAMSKITGYTKSELKKINIKDTYHNPEERKLFVNIF